MAHSTWKVNAVRLAMYTDERKGYCSDGDKTFIKNLMIEGIKAATELGMYVLVPRTMCCMSFAMSPTVMMLPGKSARLMRRKGFPVFVSEFGMCDASGAGSNNPEQTAEWFKLIDKYNAGFFCWAMGNRDECCCIVKPESKKLSGWTEEDLTDSGIRIRERFLSKAE